MGQRSPTAETSLEKFDKVNSVNYRGLWMCAKQELKLMLKNDVKPFRSFGLSDEEANARGQRGSIVNIASQLGIVSRKEGSSYLYSDEGSCSFIDALRRNRLQQAAASYSSQFHLPRIDQDRNDHRRKRGCQ
jgi:NAD(P)-dependent dehydrogenase (short-subunit alcohol dehydrogenase family)